MLALGVWFVLAVRSAVLSVSCTVLAPPVVVVDVSHVYADTFVVTYIY